MFTIESEALISLSDDESFQNDDSNIKVKLEKVMLRIYYFFAYAFIKHQTISALKVLRLGLFHYIFAFII